MTTINTTSSTTTASRGASGIGCIGLALLTTVIFGTLKLAGVMEMGWLWVFAPTLAVLGLTGAALLALLLVLGVGAAIVAIASAASNRKRKAARR